MGLVIPWKNKSARQEVIELARAVLAQAECGELKSLFVVGETTSQGVNGAAAGGFADDPVRGARVASRALQAMLKKTGACASEETTVTMEEELPSRLRRRRGG
jgi:aspartate oxidase